MKKNQNDRGSQQSTGKSNQSSAGKKKENLQINYGNPIPDTPEKNIPVKPDIDNDPTRPEPGINEPEKNDPTRIDEPSPIFNNK